MTAKPNHCDKLMSLEGIGFDFDEMSRLAKDDPNGFARQREELIKKVVENAAEPKTLAGMQLSIDGYRYSNGIGQCTVADISDLALAAAHSLMNHVDSLSTLLNEVVQADLPTRRR